MPKKSPPPKAPPIVRVTTRRGPFEGVSPAVVKRRAEKMLAVLDLPSVELSVALVDDTTIHELNRSYRHKNKPTDVLAFPMQEDASKLRDGDLLGDVIVSIETARKQAKERKRPLLDELTMLLAHGLLHLVGYDHKTDAEERVMVQKTRELEVKAQTRMRR